MPIAPTIDELERMSDEELRRRYNEEATRTEVGLGGGRE